MCSPDVAITHEIASTTGAASATCESAPKWDPVAELVSGAKVRARRCSMRSQSERKARSYAIFLTSDCGTVRTIIKSARTFAPLTQTNTKPLNFLQKAEG